MTTFKGLLHKIDSLELLKMKMKTRMTKKRKEMHEEEREVEEVITKILERYTKDVSLYDPPQFSCKSTRLTA